MVERPQWREPWTGLLFVRLEPGTFVMGSPAGEPLREAQERQHAVTLTRGFWMSTTEVTQEQWFRVMGTAPSRRRNCPRCPVENVNLHEIRGFLHALGQRDPGQRFRLPTEAEWEYACRAGTSTAFAFGDAIDSSQANVHGHWPYPPGAARSEHRAQPVEVASFAPNAWGLFDLHGNVWEWTEDEHCGYGSRDAGDGSADDAGVDPLGRCNSPLHVIRGGSWGFGADSARCALRYTHSPADRGPGLGFRLVRDDAGGPAER
jgi:formylglycine-generating enzyme required for sulfatase activity